MVAGEEGASSGKDGCRVFCADVVGTGCTITGGTGVEPVAVVVGSDVASDVFTSLTSSSVICQD